MTPRLARSAAVKLTESPVTAAHFSPPTVTLEGSFLLPGALARTASPPGGAECAHAAGTVMLAMMLFALPEGEKWP